MPSSVGIGIIAFASIFTLEGIFPYFQNRQKRFHHALPNIVIVGITAVIEALLLGNIISSMRWSTQRDFGLLNALPISSHVKMIAAIILFDLWMYGWHRLNHQISFFWRFHRMHHSDPAMDATTALRFHPGEIFLSTLCNIVIFILLGMTFAQWVFYRSLVLPIIIFHHSNIALPKTWDRFFCTLIVTPNMHRVHHSENPIETDSNFSSIFSFWDRLFASFRDHADTLTIHLGLRDFRDPSWQNIRGLLLTPLADIGKPSRGKTDKPKGRV